MKVFNVLVQNGYTIEFQNFFEFGQWERIESGLKGLKKKLIKVHKNNFGPKNCSIPNLEAAFNELAKEYFIDRRFKFNGSLTCIDDFLEERLRSECMYYFWAKCEWEVVVSGWPNEKVSRKIDIYEQLLANWDIFKKLAFDNI